MQTIMPRLVLSLRHLRYPSLWSAALSLSAGWGLSSWILLGSLHWVLERPAFLGCDLKVGERRRKFKAVDGSRCP